MSSDEPLVLVTGATGYIAQHVILLLLRRGYRVRGTIRNLNDSIKVRSLQNLCPDSLHPLELMEANLMEDIGWPEAVHGCTYIIHLASPVLNHTPKNEDYIIVPAVEGTRRVLNACARAGTVKRVVLTSSIRAVHAGWTNNVDGIVYTEKDWTDVNSKYLSAYDKSKILSEKFAWDYVKNLDGKNRFELVVLNPGLVLGPVLNKSCRASVQLIYRMMSRLTMPMVPRLSICICDVRDLAMAHLQAMVIPEAAGQRHLVVSGNMWMTEMTEVISKEFSHQGYAIPKWKAPYSLTWLYSFLDKSTAFMLMHFGQVLRYDNARMKDVLGVVPRDMCDTVLDTVYSFIQHEIIPRRKS